jgi:hypothetical protein
MQQQIQPVEIRKQKETNLGIASKKKPKDTIN